MPSFLFSTCERGGRSLVALTLASSCFLLERGKDHLPGPPSQGSSLLGETGGRWIEVTFHFQNITRSPPYSGSCRSADLISQHCLKMTQCSNHSCLISKSTDSGVLHAFSQAVPGTLHHLADFCFFFKVQFSHPLPGALEPPHSHLTSLWVRCPFATRSTHLLRAPSQTVSQICLPCSTHLAYIKWKLNVG